jgi:pyruvate-ferredoxin/flavodoxin oxidoreductase
MGVIAAATGDTASKYVARRETPLYIPENCTQCMECISVCPDTALPNTSQDLSTLLTTAVTRYVADPPSAPSCSRKLPEIEKLTRQRMVAEIKTGTPLPTILREVTDSRRILASKPSSSSSTSSPRCRWPTRRSTPSSPRPSARRPAPAASSPSLSAICARAARPASPPAATTSAQDGAGDRRSQRRARNRHRPSSTCCPTLRRSILGLFNAANPADSKTATLRNMLMVRTNYDALVSGDGACAGCGEKSVLRSIAAVTEAYMRPVYHAKSDRFVAKAGELEKNRRRPASPLSRRATPPSTRCSARPSRTSSSASAAKT